MEAKRKGNKTYQFGISLVRSSIVFQHPVTLTHTHTYYNNITMTSVRTTLNNKQNTDVAAEGKQREKT
jgi:hypothetical protein